MAERSQRSLTSDIDRLVDAVNSIRMCLKCTICLDLMTIPVKTRCGHSFCKSCIAEILKNKAASCPLCVEKLDRRKVSKDDHLQSCIEKFNTLVSAIEMDSDIDILSYSKPRRDTKESRSDASQSSKNSSKGKPSRQSSIIQIDIDKPSTSRGRRIDCNNPRDNSSSLNKNAPFPNAGNDDAIHNSPEIKVRTWLHTISEESSANVLYMNTANAEAAPIIQTTVDDDKSGATSEIPRKRAKKSRKTNQDRKKNTDKDGAFQIKKGARTRRSSKAGTIDSGTSDTSGLKYKTIHAKIRAKEKEKMKKEKKSDVEEISNQTSSSSTTATIDASDRPNLDAASANSANWSSVLEFGKEITKKRESGVKKMKMKKLSISIKKLPQVVENVVLTPNSKFDPAKIMPNRNTSEDKMNVPSNLPEESIRPEQDTTDKNLDLSNTEMTPLKASSKMNARAKESSPKNKSNNSSFNLSQDASYIQLEEGRKIRIINLNNNEMSRIIGLENSEKCSQRAENSHCEKNSRSTAYHNSSLPPRKRLIILTPEKFNESMDGCEIIHDGAQASARTSENSSYVTAREDRTAEHRGDSSTQKASEKSFSPSPRLGRLSLRRKPGIGGKQSANSPLSQVSLADRLLDSRHEKDSPALKDDAESDRMRAVRRHLNLDVSNVFGESTASGSSKDIQNKKSGPSVEFIQLGSMVRLRRRVFSYLGSCRRELLLPAEIPVHTVCNMIDSHIAETSESLATFPNPSIVSQTLSNATMIENIRFADNLNATLTAPANAELPAATTCKVSATSTPKKNIDCNLRRKGTIEQVDDERSSMNASKRLKKSIEDTEGSAQSLHKSLHADRSAIQERSSHAHSRMPNSIKLLSPDKDSQLKFLALDFPSEERADSMSRLSEHKETPAKVETFFNKNFRYTTSTSMAQDLSHENSEQKKRTQCADEEELLKELRCHSDDSVCSQATVKLNSRDRSSKDAKSNSDTKKYSVEQDTDDILLDVMDTWNNEHSATQRMKESENPRNSDESRCSKLEINLASHQSPRSTSTLESEKRMNAKPSQRSSANKDTDTFESCSIFNSDNVEFMLQQMMRSPEKIATPTNDDIINRVLRIDQSRDNSDACQSPGPAPRSDRTSQREKRSGDYLLQDNFDGTLASVDLPQSEDAISSIDQPARNPSRTLAEQKTSNCPAMTDELCGATPQETPVIRASSTSDIFEHCSYSGRNVRKPYAKNVATGNADKENAMSGVNKKHDAADERDDKRSITARKHVDAVDKDSRREFTSKHNVSHEKEKPFDCDESLQMEEEHNASTVCRLSVDRLHDDFESDSLMNVTENQAHLQIFEADLFSSPTTHSAKRTRTTSQDLFREEQRTPKRRKLNTQEKSAASMEHSIEEDDVVENTPERKRENNESNIKMIESRKNISIYGRPLDESTPKVPHKSNRSSDSFKTTDSSKDEAILSGSILLPKQANDKTLENIRQVSDRRRLCFVCTGLQTVQVSRVKELAARHNASCVNQFGRNVTHVIVNTTGERNIAKSTLKYLQGIAHRKWIVSYRWVEDCLAKQKLLDEVPYEATTCYDNLKGVDGPRNSRLREKGLFEGFTFLCIGPYNNVSREQYQDLLLASGATVVDSLKDLAKKDGLRGIMIADDTHSDEIEDWYRAVKTAIINVDWIVDCIGQYKLLKFSSYIQYPPLEDLRAIGYPPDLAEDHSDDDE